MTRFRSLRRRLLQPLLILSAIAAVFVGLGVYWFENKALQSDLQQRGQLLSTALIISAETSTSLADFHRTVLAIASEPSIESIIILDLDYQPIFSGDHYDINKAELNNLETLIKNAKATGLSIGTINSRKDYIYEVVTLINISALPQENFFKPKSSLLLVSLHTRQAVNEAFINAVWLTMLLFFIGLIAFTSIYYLINKLVLIPSQRIVEVMKSQSLKKNESTGFQPENEMGLIGQTFDQLAEKLNAREQSLELALIKAQDASNAKSQFLASMSHEIRTPMNGVIGMLHLLKKESLSEKQNHYIQVAKSSADSLLSLINDILDVSKIEAGKLDIEIINFDIHRLFSNIASTMSHRIQSPELALTLDIDGIKNQVVQGDPNRIQQIIINLVGNAIKFTRHGEITIHAVLNSVDHHADKINNSANKLQLQCDITDTGIGISNDKLNQLFDSFTQADSSTTREYGGTGLGLSIVKQLCQIMGGDVKVTSELGQGSQFSFTINLGLSDNSLVLQDKKYNTEGSHNKFKHHEHQRVLLVEDNAINQLVAAGILENLGIHTDIAEDGLEAIDSLRQARDNDYSLIFMDCQMPIMDGFTATKNIRKGDAGERYRDIPIVAMTANAMHGDREKCIQAGMNDYLAKPIDEILLVECLTKWLTAEIKLMEVVEPLKNGPTLVFKAAKSIVWDQAALLEVLGNQKPLVARILSTFLKDMPELINKLEHHIKDKEIAGLKQEIHSIKGVAGNIYATELHTLSEVIENMMQKNLMEEIINFWPEFEEAYQRLNTELRKYLEK